MRKSSKVLLRAVAFAVGISAVVTRDNDLDGILAAEEFQKYLDRMKELDRSIKEEIGVPRVNDFSQCRSIPLV